MRQSLLDFVLHNGVVRTYLCTRQKWDAGYACPPRQLTDTNLLYLRRGRITWTVGAQMYPLVPGTLLVVPPGGADHGEAQTRRVDLISFHVDYVCPGGQDAFSLLALPALRAVASTSRLAGYFEQVCLEYERGDAAQTRLSMPGWAHLIVQELLRHDAAQGTLRNDVIDPIVRDVLTAIDRRLAEPLSADDLAQIAGYSRQHLNRRFQTQLGLTPMQWLMQRRLEKAIDGLIEGKLTVKAIAKRVGYDDPAYFNRIFKQHIGCTPMQYRQDRGRC